VLLVGHHGSTPTPAITPTTAATTPTPISS
jgi:hypothetical protein